MKLSNQEIQDRLEGEELNRTKGFQKLAGLYYVVVRQCKYCKHDTLQEHKCKYYGAVYTEEIKEYYGSPGLPDTVDGFIHRFKLADIYTCFNCGKKFECKTKTVCKEIKEELDGKDNPN